MADTNITPESVFEKLRNERETYLGALVAKNTSSGYRYSWERFVSWCSEMEVNPLPAVVETVSLYVVYLLADHKASTVMHYVSAIGNVHRAHGYSSPFTPQIRKLLLGARRLRTERVRQVNPLTLDNVVHMSALLIEDGTALAARDRSLILLGFATALRSANLVALNMEDFEIGERGLKLSIRKSKTDQTGRGRIVAVPWGQKAETCPILALSDWLKRRGDFPGPVYTSFDCHQDAKVRSLQPERVGQLVQRCVARIGLDASLYGSHSMRSGCISELAIAGCSELNIAQLSGHSDLATLRGYIRRADPWRAGPGAAVGL